MISVSITKSEKITVQYDGSELLSVEFDVMKDGEFKAHYAHGFPLNTTAEEIREYFKNYCTNENANEERAAQNAEREAALKQADETIEEVQGLTITADAVTEGGDNVGS